MNEQRDPTRYQPLTARTVTARPEWRRLDPELQEGIQVAAQVLPFRTNTYVLEELIDWSRVPEDPMFQLVFPQREMLEPEDYAKVAGLMRRAAPREELRAAVHAIRAGLNPHPDGQMTHNVPRLAGRPLPGLQHKYRETVLFFPAAGQTCHAYCTYCFRWAQFVEETEWRFQAREAEDLVAYLQAHREVTDVLITGGDPMIMKTSALRRYIEPLLAPGLEHVQSIRIGTKSVAYWPQRFTTDADADDCLRLFEEVAAAGKHLALMAHYSHPVELEPEPARQAIRRIRATGAEMRMQAPLIRHVNDSSAAWAALWRQGVRLGMIPYYMFVERDTGPRGYFEVPLVRALRIYRRAFRQVSGLARTVRGPSMSAFPGKVRVAGVAELYGRRVFTLEFLQARDTSWVGRPFFARYDPEACWLDELEPAFGEERFFFEESLERPSRRERDEGAFPRASLPVLPPN
ncbi:MAG: KamA family radical SAM protein [Thermoanaerobaculia bacterium]